MIGITEEQFYKARAGSNSGKQTTVDKFIIAVYYLEKENLNNARAYIPDIIDAIDKEQQIKLANALSKEIKRLQTYQYQWGGNFNDDDICCLITLYQKLSQQEVDGVKDCLLQGTDSYKSTLKLVEKFPKSLSKLALMHKNGDFGFPKNIAEALNCYKKAYELNKDPNIANTIGCIYSDRDDGENAIKFFKEASDRNNFYASYNLGFKYHYGKFVAKDIDKAETYYKKSVQQVGYGKIYTPAHYRLGLVYKEFHNKGKKQSYYSSDVNYYLKLSKEHYSKAANNGHDDACLELACIYESEQDIKNAEIYFKKAADNNHCNSQYRIACLYTLQNKHHEAHQYYQKAAKAGHGNAQFRLGCQYEKGEGVVKDLSKAFSWLYEALQNNTEEAKKKLENKLDQMGHYYDLYKNLKNQHMTFDDCYKKMIGSVT